MCSKWSQFLNGDSADGAAGGDSSDGAAGGDSSDGAGGPEAPAAEAPMSVSALVASVTEALNRAFPAPVTVVGEVSNFTHHSSGHMYFRLKDAGAAIDAAMFRGRAAKLKFKPADGLEVVVTGRVDVYESRGQLQLYVERMEPVGAGALELAFRQLCDKLRTEGLFEADAKKPIPRLPRAIGVVTSPTGAALRDIRRTLGRRWPAATVYLLGTLVQGDAAAARIAAAVKLLDAAAQRLDIDTIIVARGGGSLEDLWAFNEEIVARAIFACRTPVISGVGHETDVTIADMVADCRAATPTAAAELAVPDTAQLRQHLAALGARLSRGAFERISSGRKALGGILRSVVFRDPGARVRAQMQRSDELSHRMASALRARLARAARRLAPQADRLAALHPAHRAALARQRLAGLARQLDAMSYRSVLARGFSVTRRGDGIILRSASEAQTGETIRTELADGTVDSTVTAKEPPSKPPPGHAPARQAPRSAPATPRAAPKRRTAADGPMLFDVEQDD